MTSNIDFFNARAATWDEHNTKSTAEKINRILTASDMAKNDSVLDIGTGTGVLLPHVARAVGAEGSICAVDFSPMMLQQAHQKYASLPTRTSFVLADVEHDGINGKFNRIMMYCVYPHIQSPVDTLRRLYHDNLACQGTITIAHPVGRHFINNMHSHCPIKSRYLPAADELAAQLTYNGLTVDYAEESPDIYIVRIRKC